MDKGKIIIILSLGVMMMVSMNLPNWAKHLNERDLDFIRDFVMCSGSLTKTALKYGCNYQEIRARLNCMMDRMWEGETTGEDPHVVQIKSLFFDDKIDYRTACWLLSGYADTKRQYKAGRP